MEEGSPPRAPQGAAPLWAVTVVGGMFCFLGSRGSLWLLRQAGGAWRPAPGERLLNSSGGGPGAWTRERAVGSGAGQASPIMEGADQEVTTRGKRKKRAQSISMWVPNVLWLTNLCKAGASGQRWGICTEPGCWGPGSPVPPSAHEILAWLP